MLQVRFAGKQGDLYIGQRCTGQNAKVLFFFQMGQNQPLPVFVQHLFPAVGGELHPAAPGQRFQQQMHLGIVAQRLVVAYALHGLGNGLLIQNAARAKRYFQPEPLCQQAAQHFQLHLTHQLHMDLGQGLVPHHMELGFFLLQPVQLAQRGVHVCALRQQHLIAEHRLQNRHIAVPLCPKPGAGLCMGQAGHGAYLSRADRLGQGILCAGVQPQLICLFCPRLAVRFAAKQGFYLQLPAGDPQPCQACALLILRYLEHPCAKGLQCRGGAGVAVQPVQKGIHSVQPQRRPEPARKNVPAADCRDDIRIGQSACVQHFFHQLLITQRQRLVAGGRLCTKIHKALAKTVVQLAEQLLLGHAGQVHLVHKHKGGHMVAPQQPPQRFGMALHAVRSADHQHGIVQHLQGTLSLGGKIHMAGGIQQGDIRTARRKQRLLGKDGDAARFFQTVSVQKSVPVVHPAQLADGTGAVEHSLGEGGLAGVHMGQNAQYDLFLRYFHALLLQEAVFISIAPRLQKQLPKIFSCLL